MVSPKEFETRLQQWGEVMAVVEEIPEPVEFHLHDTELFENYVVHELSDGEVTIDYERIGPVNKHYNSLEEYGLE